MLETIRSRPPEDPRVAALEQRLAMLESAPQAVEQKRAAEAHREAIAELRAAENRFIDAERAAEMAREASTPRVAEIRRLEELLQKARVEHWTELEGAQLAMRSAQNEVRARLAVIHELPAWKKFNLWSLAVEQILSHAFIDQREDALHGQPNDEVRLRLHTDNALRERLQARRNDAEKALLAYRASVNAARTVHHSETEALAAAVAALDRLKEFYSLPRGMSWPSPELTVLPLI